MGIVTRGLGSRGIVTQGYFSWIKEVIKKVTQLIRRFIPRERRPFASKIAVKGFPIVSFSKGISIEGNPFSFKKVSLPARGSLVDSFSASIKTVGTLSISVQDTLSIQGSSVLKYFEKLHCEGEKDFKKIIWEILEDE